MTQLPSPTALKRQFSLSLPQRNFIQAARRTASAILKREDNRLACIIGPCSIHEITGAVEYAKRLSCLSKEISRSLFLVMRVFCEKPRTKAGWKGMLYDPDLDGTWNVAKGLSQTRQLLLALADCEIPCAAEFLDPLAAPYYDDLITWGFIGARTAASQPHRQLASAFPFPIGFKNTIFGEIDVAINGILSARTEQIYLGIDNSGRAAAKRSRGNLHTHLVLRGSEERPNFDAASVQEAIRSLERYDLEPNLLIDCSHGNSGKDQRRQRLCFDAVLNQVKAGVNEIAGLMIESHLLEGKQPHGKALHYGLSITDSCIGWEETEDLLLSANATLCPMSISSVQK